MKRIRLLLTEKQAATLRSALALYSATPTGGDIPDKDEWKIEVAHTLKGKLDDAEAAARGKK